MNIEIECYQWANILMAINTDIRLLKEELKSNKHDDVSKGIMAANLVELEEIKEILEFRVLDSKKAKTRRKFNSAMKKENWEGCKSY